MSLIKLTEEAQALALSCFGWAGALSFLRLKEGTRIVQLVGPEQNHPDGGLGAFPRVACAPLRGNAGFHFRTICVGDSLEREGANPRASPQCAFCVEDLGTDPASATYWLFDPGKLCNLSGLSFITWNSGHSVCMTRRVVRLNESTSGEPLAWHQRETPR